MSKIICDICGTSYPETEKRCPICGCVCDGDVQRATSEISKEGNVTTGYTYVKGGRFSKSNVKKRNKQSARPAKEEKRAPIAAEPVIEDVAPVKSSRGLVITAILLLLAIVAVVVYISVHYFSPISDDGKEDNSTTASQQKEIPCTSIKFDTTPITFDKKDDSVLLDVKRVPADTTDAISFESADESIAIVNKTTGMITAVGNGTTKIIITCGEVTRELEVTCQIPDDTTSDDTNTDDTTTDDDEKNDVEETLKLNRNDITFQEKGSSWMIYSGTIAKNLITWSSDNEEVATITDGKVVAVGSGTTKVYAEYGDQKVSCIIRCVFKDSVGIPGNGGVSEDGGGTPTPGNGGVSEDGGNTASVTYSIYTQYGDKTNDITISVGGKCGLYLKDSNGNTVQATWTCSGSACTLSGSTVTGVGSGTSTVTATYNGTSVNCIVRVN